MSRANLACCTAVWLLAGVASAEEPRPKAVAVEPIVDVEVVPRGDAIVHAFEIRNEGDAPLEITDVSPACGCTVAEYDRSIKPGGVGRVRASLDTTDFAGPVAKSIAVFTNDPENPKLQLVIKADIKPYILAKPGYARFVYVQGEPLRSIPQTVWAADNQDIKILRVQTPGPHVKASYRPARPEEKKEDVEGQQLVIEVEIEPDSPVGALGDYIEVTVDHPKQQLLKIPVSGFVRPRQHVTPAEIEFGNLEATRLPMQRTVDFVNFATSGIEVTKIETGVPGLEAEARGLGETGHRFKLRLTLSNEMAKGEFSSTMKIHITDEKNPVVEVPIRGSIL